MSTSITIRISEDLKRKMDKVKKVNWSEVVRRAIVDRLKMEEKLRTKNWELVGRASKKSDDIRESLERICGKSDYDSAETIRGWRDARLWREQS
jgi:metal-responsive CopG/Arc/MetJ family transcriptional regulator